MIRRMLVLGALLLVAAVIPGTRANREAIHAMGGHTPAEAQYMRCNPIAADYHAAEARGASAAEINAIVDRYEAAGCQPPTR